MAVYFTTGNQKPPFQGMRLGDDATLPVPAPMTTLSLNTEFVRDAGEATLLFYLATHKGMPGWTRILSGILGVFAGIEAFRNVTKP